MEIKFAKPFANFKNLTQLRLGSEFIFKSSDCISFFSHLGQSCPQVKKLTVKLLGPLYADLLSPTLLSKIEAGEINLHTLQFAPEHVTQLCHSLEEFEANFGFISFEYEDDEIPYSVTFHAWSIAFLLRRMPRVKKFDLAVEKEDESFDESN